MSTIKREPRAHPEVVRILPKLDDIWIFLGPAGLDILTCVCADAREAMLFIGIQMEDQV